MPKPVVAVLIARGSASTFPLSGLKYKALLPLNGAYMADYVLRALQASDAEKVVIVQAEDEGLERLLAPGEKNLFAVCPEENPTLADSVLCGIEKLLDYYGEDRFRELNVMLVPCDIPLARAADFNHLIQQNQSRDADICVTAIPSRYLKASLPGRRFFRMYVNDLDDVFTPQNINFISSRILGFQQEVDGKRRVAVFDRDGRLIDGASDIVDSLRQRRRWLLAWPLLIYSMFLKRLAKKHQSLVAHKLALDLLRRKLTLEKMRQALYVALNLRFDMLESDSAAFSADIDTPEDLEQCCEQKGKPNSGVLGQLAHN